MEKDTERVTFIRAPPGVCDIISINVFKPTEFEQQTIVKFQVLLLLVAFWLLIDLVHLLFKAINYQFPLMKLDVLDFQPQVFG